MSLGIKRTRPLRVVLKSFEGTPSDIVGEFDNIFAWTRRRNLRVGEPDMSGRMNLPWTAVFFDEAATTPETPRRIDLWIPIEGAGPSQPGFSVKDIPHDSVAFMIHRGPMSRLDESVQQLFTWVEQKQLGFRARIHRRLYLRGVDGPPEDPDWEAEVQIPLLAARS